MAKSTSTQEGVCLATTILVYLGTEDGMVDKSTLVHKASWPGIKLAEGDISLRLQAGKSKESMRGKALGCPVALIVSGVPWAAAPGPLKSNDIKSAIGALLAEGVDPDNSPLADSINRKWEKLTRTPGDLKPKKWASRGP
jgi:hypothetical protein